MVHPHLFRGVLCRTKSDWVNEYGKAKMDKISLNTKASGILAFVKVVLSLKVENVLDWSAVVGALGGRMVQACEWWGPPSFLSILPVSYGGRRRSEPGRSLLQSMCSSFHLNSCLLVSALWTPIWFRVMQTWTKHGSTVGQLHMFLLSFPKFLNHS